MDICLLGCGGMVPMPNRNLTALLVRQNGKMILIDCGEGTQVSIKKAGWGFKSIDAVLFTHYHADHIAGLPGFLLTLGNSGRKEPFTIYGPPPLRYIIQSLTVIAPELPYEVRLAELSNQESCRFPVNEMIVESLPVDHFIPCLAYSIHVKRAGKFNVEKAKQLNIPMKFWNRLQKGKTAEFNGIMYEPGMVLEPERKGLKITYCTDTRPTEQLVDFSSGSDLFICEGMYGDDTLQEKAIERKHMIFSEAAEIAAKSQSTELWLTHYSPSLENPELWMENAKRLFSYSIAGQDLMKKELFFQD